MYGPQKTRAEPDDANAHTHLRRARLVVRASQPGWSASWPPVMASAAAKAVMAGSAVIGARRRSALSPPGAARRWRRASRRARSASSSSGSSRVARLSDEMALAEREHRGRGALAGLAALGRHHRDLLQEQRALERRRPGGAGAEHDRGARRPGASAFCSMNRSVAAIARSTAAGAPASSAASASSPVTRAQTASAVATPPQKACVCVSARWLSTVWTARPSAELARATSRRSRSRTPPAAARPARRRR